jgi:ATP-dependent Clp protease protease subunit
MVEPAAWDRHSSGGGISVQIATMPTRDVRASSRPAPLSWRLSASRQIHCKRRAVAGHILTILHKSFSTISLRKTGSCAAGSQPGSILHILTNLLPATDNNTTIRRQGGQTTVHVPPLPLARLRVHSCLMSKTRKRKSVPEIAVIGDVDDWEADVVRALLDVPHGGECTFFVDSAGGSVYGALAVLTLLRHRRMTATAVVLGECSSAALLLFAACKHRQVTAYSTLLFHRMRWQSEKRVGSEEAFLWAKHFEDLEKDIDDLQVRLFGKAEDQVRHWTRSGCYVTGPQVVAAGLAELIEV